MTDKDWKAEYEKMRDTYHHLLKKASHNEAMAHQAGFEAGRQIGMKQERALWELAASTQEIEK